MPDGSGLFFGNRKAGSIYRLNYPAKTIDTIQDLTLDWLPDASCLSGVRR